MKRLTGLVVLGFLSFAGCQWLEEHLPSRKGLSSSEDSKPITATVPWKGDAIAADTFIKIAKRANPAVVNIGTTKVVKQRQHPFFTNPFGDFFGNNDDLFERFFGSPRGQAPEMKQQSLGSGFIVSEDGLIVTNNHVVDRADEIRVTVGVDQDFQAKVIGTDPKTDLALIKIDAGRKLETLPLGDSDELQVGEIVVAIGNPFGLSHTVTQGIVSAKERTIGFGPYDNFIQTDASINQGNSGGPLLNLRAEVVGINSAILATGQGIGFAIPVNLAKNIVGQLKDKGSVTRGWLGVFIQPVDADLAKALEIKEKRGAVVSGVQEGSPAAKAGIEPRDVITEFDGKTINDYNDLPRFVATAPIGKTVKLKLLRGGKALEVQAKIQELTAAAEQTGPAEEKGGEASKPDQLGLSVSTLTPALAEQMGLDPAVHGVVVERVLPGGAAAEKRLRRGDVILEVNRKKTPNLDAYLKAIKPLKKGDSVLLLIKRGEASIFIAFPL